MNDQSKKTIDEDGVEVLDPSKALQEQTLAVDLARIEIDQAIATAHKFPRIIDTVMKKISTLACYNKDSAENCIYALPRGGKPIIGPSIGFANIVCQSWGNCRVGARITYIDTKQKVVIAEGAFLDLETNAQSIVPVQRRIVDKHGRLFSEDMQIVTGMAAASIARRNAILQGVSRGLWHPIWTDALGIVRGDVTTFAENKASAFKALAQFGVKSDQVIMYLGLRGEIDLTFEHLPTLRGMYVALRDGSTTVEEMFDPRRMTGRGFETVDNPLGDSFDDADGAEAQSGTEQAGSQADPAQEAKNETAAADARPQAQQQPKTAATAKQAKAAASPSLLPEDKPAANSSQPGGQQTRPAQEAAKAEPEQPANAEAYIAHWRAFCASATSAAQVKNQYSAERQLRKNCEPITSDQHEEITQLKDERMAQLSSK